MNAQISLRDRILADMKLAMKNKKASELQALRLIYAECRNKEIELKTVLDDIQLVAILRKQVKQYKESIEQYEKAGRQEGVFRAKRKIELNKVLSA